VSDEVSQISYPIWARSFVAASKLPARIIVQANKLNIALAFIELVYHVSGK
jgi:hypothetical protein